MKRLPWGLLASTLVLNSCLSMVTPGDRYFEMGAYGKAAQEYALQLGGDKPLRHRDRVLYRLAFSYAIRRNPGYDLAKARELFVQLIREYPQSSYSLRAETLVGWVDQAHRLQQRLAQEQRRAEELELETSRLRANLEMANSAATETDGLTATLHRQIEARDVELRLLAKRLTESSRRIRQLTKELEDIKRLDLADPP